MAQQITNFFQRGNRGSSTSSISPVKARSLSTSKTPNSALKPLSTNRKYSMSRDIPQLSPSKKEVFVFCDPKPRKHSDNENSDICSSQESNHSSGSTSGARKVKTKPVSKPSAKKPQPMKALLAETKEGETQTDIRLPDLDDYFKVNPKGEEEDCGIPREALDLLRDEPSEHYYKDLAEARREALAECLEENQNLHALNEQLHGEKERLSISFLDLSTHNESLKSELAKFSKLNETLEEENRLLKEALGLDKDEDDDGD